tara:strand:+ start:653 stop:1084 length:432 start_codon:yes stop_codon:yes gene_type:complete
MNSEIWGPHYWFVIHTMAFNYPNKPNVIDKKSHYKFVQDLPLFIPDKKSSRNFIQILKLYPVLPYLDNRKDFIKWTHFIHNRVNESLGKDQISLKDFYISYFNNYKSTNEKTNNSLKDRKIKLYILTISLLLIISYYMNKKKL